MKLNRKIMSLIATILSILMVMMLLCSCAKEVPHTDNSAEVQEQSAETEEPINNAADAFKDVGGDESDYDIGDIKTYDADDVGDNIIEFEPVTVAPIEIETFTYEGKIIEFEAADIDLDFSFDIYSAFEDSESDVEVNKDNGEVTMDSSVLFGVDSYAISKEGKKSLKEFIDDYVDVVLGDDHKDSVNAIVVEGHTDTDGTHEYNQELSEKRAKAVIDYCVSIHPELKDVMVSKGCSYDNPIKNDDGTVNKEASRRVVFRVIGK